MQKTCLLKGHTALECPTIDSEERAFAVAAKMEMKMQPHTEEAFGYQSHLPGSGV